MPSARKRPRQPVPRTQRSLRRQRRRQRRIGLLGGVIVVLFSVLVLLIWRDSAWNAGSRLAALIVHKPVAPTQPGHLGVAVAGLDGDRSQANTALVRTALAALAGVQLKALDPPVTLATDPSGLIHSKVDAPGVLASADADVLVWGKVLSEGGVGSMQLYLTDRAGPAALHFDDAERTVVLPPLDWDILRPVLAMVVQSRLAALAAERTGRYEIAVVTPAIDEVRSLRQEFSAVWPPETAADIDMALAEVLRDAGDQTENDALLHESVELYRDALTLRPHAQAPLAWAAAQDGMGMAFAALGRRETQTSDLESALQAYQDALQERTREHAPLQYAATQHNMGVAYWMIGLHSSGPARLAAAVRAEDQALSVLKQDAEPLEWATAENDLGVALQSLANREGTPGRLDEAIAAYRKALQERVPKLVPLQWAATKNDLGTALEAKAEHGKSTEDLKEAVTDYEDALRERTRERAPLAWAETQHNLGNALTAIGDGENSVEHLQQAVAAYRGSLLELTRDKTSAGWATTQADLGIALTTLGQRTQGQPGEQYLQQAIAAYGEALQVQTQKASPFDWATTTGNQGVTMMLLAERTYDEAKAKAAMQQIQAALDMMHAARMASGAAFYQAQLVKAKAVVTRLSDQ